MIVGVLLAAGRGERFGGGKMLARLPNGVSMLEASATAMAAALGTVVLVVRDNDTLLAEAHRVMALLAAADANERGAGSAFRVVINDRADAGMATSLVAGVGAAPDAAGWVIGLADMPFTRASTIAEIAAAVTTTHAIVIPRYAGQRGHPVAFGRDYRRELLLLRGDVGARAICQNHAEEVVELTVDDPGVVRDIDTRAQLSDALPDALRSLR